MEVPQTETSVERTEEQLVELVKNQVEYYFSKENLMGDPFLSSQMDAQMCVPISIVMKFAKLKALTQDESILRKALVDSTAVSIIDNKIKANIKPPGRNTIILREIPSDAPVEEVKEIFNYPGAKNVSSIRSEIGDTWFVAMDSEEEAKDTLLDLRLKKRTFRGVSVKGRLKTETVVRSFFPVQTGIAPVVPFPGIMGAGVPMPVVDMRAFGYMGMPMPVIPGADGSVDTTVAGGAEVPAAVAAAPAETRSSPNKGTQGSTPSSGGKDSRGKSQNGQSAAKGSNGAQGRRQDGAAASSSRGNGKGGKDKKEEAAAPRPTIELNLASFPPLGGADDTPVPTPGYKGPFVKYSGDEIIHIAKGVKEAKLPESLNPSHHPIAMTVEPNKDLLKRQRTFSIDETREQLRQGRPVQREAILPGKVDSRSLYYGDEPSAPAQTRKDSGVPVAPVTSPAAAKKIAASAPIVQAAAAVSVIADTIEELTATTAAMAVSDTPSIVEAMNMGSPQKITPSTWAAMLKSSASAAEASSTVAARPAQTAPKRTPAKEGKAAAPVSSSKPKGEKDSEGGKSRRKNSEGSKEGKGKGEGDAKEGNSRRKPSGDASATPSKTDKTSEGSDGVKSGDAPAASWGGKASFANILKLNAEAEAFQPAAAAPAAAAPKASAASNNNNDRRRTSAPSKPSASSSAAASKRDTKPAAAAGGEWSTSTGKAKKETSSRDREPRESRSSAGRDSGANANGVWARETLPPAAAVAAEK